MAIAERQTSTEKDARVSIAMLEKFDKPMHTKWGKMLEGAVEPNELDVRSRAVLRVALDSIMHWSPEICEEHVEDAFDAGSNITEIIEACLHLSALEGGGHSLHDGLEALEMVIRARTKSGKPTPLAGKGLGPTDMTKEAPWPVPPVFPMHFPNPRWHVQIIDKYTPELSKAYHAWNDARFKTRKELTRRMQELLVTACDVAIYWPEPLLDHHMHAAFETGATGQEILETIVLAASVVAGAKETNFCGRPMEGGVPALHCGIMAFERVTEQRKSKGLLAPADKNAPKTGKIALTL